MTENQLASELRKRLCLNKSLYKWIPDSFSDTDIIHLYNQCPFCGKEWNRQLLDAIDNAPNVDAFLDICRSFEKDASCCNKKIAFNIINSTWN